MGQSLTIRILPSRSMTLALISPTLSLSRMDSGFLPLRISERISGMQRGHSESVSLEEGRIDGHHVLEVAVNGAILDHQDLAVALDDFGLDLAHLIVEQDGQRLLAAEDFRADLGDAAGAQRVGLARPPQRGLGL